MVLGGGQEAGSSLSMLGRTRVRAMCNSRLAVPREHPGWYILDTDINVACFPWWLNHTLVEYSG